jgi:hypothetical protein
MESLFMRKINRDGVKWRFCGLFFAVSAAMLALWPGDADGVSRGEIDQIRKLSVLQESHLAKLEQYITEQFELMKTSQYDSDTSNPVQDLSETSQSDVRRDVQLQKIYSDKFASVVQTANKNLWSYAEGLADKKQAGELKLQGMVVLANADNMGVLDDLLALCEDKAMEIRYWAVKGLTMPRVQEYLRANGAENDAARQKVITVLDKILDAETGPLVMGQIALAGLPESSGGRLLQKCVSKRIALYKNWQVDNELVDLDILGAIMVAVSSGQMSNSQQAEVDLMRSAVELYTAAFLRYIKGMRHEAGENKVMAVLPEESQYELLTLLVEGEKGFIRMANSTRSVRFMADAKKQNWAVLYNSFNRLLGPKGDLQQVFHVYPATMEEGQYLVEIADVPQSLVDAAVVREKIKENVISYP